MTHLDTRHVDPVLTPKHATLVDDDTERARLMSQVDQEDEPDGIAGLISQKGRVLAWHLSSGERVIYEGEIKVHRNGQLVEGWEPIGAPRLYRATTDDHGAIAEDVTRLFLAHSIRTGAASRYAGWRERIVAMIPEEVGAKESKIIRTTVNGGIDWTHTYDVLDAYATYARWVNELAIEFGSSDELLAMKERRESAPDEGGMIRKIVQAWLLREAADAQLVQARHSLKFSLAGHARMLKEDHPGMSIAELARSLYTDRPNLSKVVKAAERDSEITKYLDAIQSGDTKKILALYQNEE
ncbi:hypothetical protein [Micromonospora haikouensis]|uniref:hypothetical protein n=1 Tax=Micromonospora haikouensis TaxID=686309 RepID=UPI003D7400BD